MSRAPDPLFRPFVPAATTMAEFTPRALLLGVLLGIVFGASSLYLVLKVGISVSASIPAAVIALTFFRLLAKAGGRDSTILENNTAQTAGSAGDSIAFGVGVTMPAILILGFDLEIGRVMLVAVLGALLGILMMIPLRRALIVEQHAELKYPEGTACAQVLIAAETAKSHRAEPAGAIDGRASIIFFGFFVALIYKVGNIVLKGWKDVPGAEFGAPLKGGSVSAEVSPELLGVGYIVGPRIASIMCAGGVLAYLLLIPLIRFFGAELEAPLAPGNKPIGAMSIGDIRSAYVLYIGAGAVAAGGVIGLWRALPTIWRSLRGTLSGLEVGGAGPLRTDRDIPLRWVLIGTIVIITVIALAAPLHMNLVGALLVVVFGFLFVAVSSRLAGQIGQSSNPVSGMTVATLLLTSLIFLLLGWTGGPYYVTALSVGAIVCVAAATAGATSQDLKTGYIVGATPRVQQYAILCGALASALVLGPVLLKLNEAATVYVPIEQVAPGLHTDAAALDESAVLRGPQAEQDRGSYRVWHKTDSAGGAPAGQYLVAEDGRAVYFVDPGINGTHTVRPDGTEVRKYDAPKAVLVSYIIKGILDRELPWALVIFGIVIAIVLELAGIPSLPFAVGVYLPLSTSAPIFIGGQLRRLADKRRERQSESAGLSAEELSAAGDRSPGVMLAAGYIAGGALAGIVIAFCAGLLSGFDRTVGNWAAQYNPFFAGNYADLLSLLPYGVLLVLLYRVGRRDQQNAR